MPVGGYALLASPPCKVALCFPGAIRSNRIDDDGETMQAIGDQSNSVILNVFKNKVEPRAYCDRVVTRK